MAKTKLIDYSKTFNCDGNILSRLVDPMKNNGMEYLGYIAYALYKIEKNTELQNYTTAHPKATDIDIQNKKNYFRYSHCNNKEINRYWQEANRIDNEMYGKKLKDYINGFENGAQGEREHLKDVFEKKVNEAIDGEIDKKYNLEKKKNYWRGVSQSLVGTIIWVVLVVIVGLYLAFGNQASNPNKTNVKQTVKETVSKTIYSAK